MNSQSRLYFCEISLQIFVIQIIVCFRRRKYIVKRQAEVRLAFGKYDLNFSTKEAKQNRTSFEVFCFNVLVGCPVFLRIHPLYSKEISSNRNIISDFCRTR